MTDQRPPRDILTYEVHVNKAYLAWLQRHAKNHPLLPQHRLGERSTPGGRSVDPDTMCLVGRVELDHLDDDIGHRDFYIGPTFRPDDGRSVVFSWVAPVAAAFFGNGRHEFSDRVRVRRTLVASRATIIDVVDEWAVAQDGEPFPAGAAGGLVVPQAPGRAARSRRPVSPTQLRARPSSQSHRTSIPQPRSDADLPGVPTFLEPQPEVPAPRLAAPEDTFASMRAAPAVLASLSAPRAERLTSVLATLQPDQYDLVTRPVDQPLVVQGHPGTGKTVIAAHRAAYLVHPERGADALDRILLIGPTDAYVRHVRGLVDGLDAAERTTIRSLDGCLMRVAGISELDTTDLLVLNDTLWQSGSLIQDAARWARARGLLDGTHQKAGRAQVWDMLRHNTVGSFPLSSQRDVKKWAKALPTYAYAVKQKRYLPLMAALALALKPVTKEQQFPHIIVDEAQDLTPIEWMIVSQLNGTDRWTLVGDMNQRHGDLSYPNWQALARGPLAHVATEPFTPEIFSRGYRSTEQILTFANRLLPQQDGKVLSLQVGGAVPEVVRTSADLLGATALQSALAMLDRHQNGTAAIITTNPMIVLQAMRKSTGWEKAASDRQLWKLGPAKVLVLTPELARGLEFDVVVVIEPAAFPESGDRRGQLYTSLTRANRELTIVHSRPLPSALRRAGCKVSQQSLSA